MASTTDALRSTRDYLLRTTDWTQVSDITLENWEEWIAYRQALRDLPANTEDPTHPEWPEPPQVKIVPRTHLETELTETKSELETLRADLANHTHPLEPHTHPELEERLANHTHPLEPHTHPLEPHTHPLEPHTHSDLVDQLAIERANTDQLQQRVTLLEHSHTALVARLEALETNM